MNHSVCAVIISYNDFESLEKTVEYVISQVDKVMIIDNKSSDETRMRIQGRFAEEKIFLVMNCENFGIAKAYNQAVDYCKSNDYDYLFTLDQDSLVDDDCIVKLLNVYEEKKDAMIVVPRVVEEWQDNISNSEGNISERKYAISSGNLILVSSFEKIGNYNEKLFIDSVDFDFSLRVRNLGGKIYSCKNAQMLHRLGEMEYKKIFGFRVRFVYHNNLRNYYNYRNSVYIFKTFMFSNTVFCIKRMIVLCYETVLNLWFNPDRSGFNSSMWQGLSDGFGNVYGRKN